MEKIVLNGGKKLQGKVKISTAKNAVLPILAACILSNDTCIIEDAPMLNDVFVICDVLRSIGAEISIDRKNNEITVDSRNLFDCEPSGELVRKMRASFLIMGPMLARFGRFRLSLPGGCNIGNRPIDLHLKGMKNLGAEITPRPGAVEAKVKELIGNKVYLDFPSVGATENIIMTAVLAKGETIIENAAEEPEIEDLANFLNAMGAKVYGAGTDTIRIIGVKSLKGIRYRPIFDRIEAGTFMIASAITGGEVTLTNVQENHIKPLIAKLKEMGVEIEAGKDIITVKKNNILKPVDIKTMPYPGFPTDMQSQIMALLCNTRGCSVVTETIFENRFMHTSELIRMGANIKVDGRSAFIDGVEKFVGCEVKATDLRAGASLVIAGLAAEGTTTITDIYHIDRGYVDIEKKFASLGADIRRIRE